MGKFSFDKAGLEEGESEGEILDEVSESIAGKNRERRVEQMTAATEDEEVLSFRIAELNSGRSFVVGYGGVWKLLSAVDKLQQYGCIFRSGMMELELHLRNSSLFSGSSSRRIILKMQENRALVLVLPSAEELCG